LVITLSFFIKVLPPFSFPQGGNVKQAPSPLGEGWEGGEDIKNRITVYIIDNIAEFIKY
jgi:hypothetical protein